MSPAVHSRSSDALIDRARNVRIEDEIERLGIKLKGNGAERVGPCPKCGGVDRFSINFKKQVFNCRGCEVGGDVITLVQHLDGSDFLTACRRLANEPSPRGSNSKDHNAQPRKVIAEEQEWHVQQKLIWADQIWRASSPLGQDAITYFARRGIDIHAVPEHGGLRFHPLVPVGTRNDAVHHRSLHYSDRQRAARHLASSD